MIMLLKCGKKRTKQMGKIGIIGRFGLDHDFYDGQTVKTKNLAWLLEREQRFSIVKVDTYLFRRKNFKLLIDTLRCMLTCEHVFLLVSVNGMNFYLPFLYYLNKLTRKKIYHYIIGSELLEMVSKNAKLVKYLNALTVNWFEYESGTRYLQEKGVTNVVTLSNFKLITPVAQATSYKSDAALYRFCTFSRVMEEKGITDAILAIKNINEKYGKVIATLDVYGPVEPVYEETLKKLLEENIGYVQYKGTVDSTQSVSVLKDYYCLLFPTRWPGEGVPGTLIDAFAAGIPVIASDWNANGELLCNGKQGLMYPNQELQTLNDAVAWAVKNPYEMDRMRLESRQEFEKYTPETILDTILNKMESNSK